MLLVVWIQKINFSCSPQESILLKLLFVKLLKLTTLLCVLFRLSSLFSCKFALVRVHAHMHAHTHTHMHAHMHAHTHTRMHTHMHAHTHTHAYTLTQHTQNTTKTDRWMDGGSNKCVGAPLDLTMLTESLEQVTEHSNKTIHTPVVSMVSFSDVYPSWMNLITFIHSCVLFESSSLPPSLPPYLPTYLPPSLLTPSFPPSPSLPGLL